MNDYQQVEILLAEDDPNDAELTTRSLNPRHRAFSVDCDCAGRGPRTLGTR